MYLLILKSSIRPFVTCFPFTFHNVSINSAAISSSIKVIKRFTFHNVSINSAIRGVWHLALPEFTFHNVSINSNYDVLQMHDNQFTFHNVSINSELAIVFQVTARHLHSIMYLLILKTSRFDHLFPVLIYIP